MEASKESITVRITRLNSQILGKTCKKGNNLINLLSRESLLDTLQALYDECCIENLQKFDKNIMEFVEKYKPVMTELKSIRINPRDFEIVNVIGRGHFGEVYAVKEKQTGDIYAMKTISKFTNFDNKLKPFEIERDIMAFNQSQWLTTLQYSFQDNSYLYFVMEYHPGGDLVGLLARQGGTLPESAATFYLAELVLALEALHSMGYIHRDIKPDNILLDRCGHLKLVDFGSAAKLNSNGYVNEGPPVGTPDYVAPEVLQSVEKKSKNGYGTSCDYWSLGILAYELVIGKTPFHGQNTTIIYSKIMNFTNNLKFPSDIVLSQAYVNFIKNLIIDVKLRLNSEQICKHNLFNNTNFNHLHDQVPPYVPKIQSIDDTSNFIDVPTKNNQPNIENFKKKSQFSGRNLPFIGFTFIHDLNEYNFERNLKLNNDLLITNLKDELEDVRNRLLEFNELKEFKSSMEKELNEKTRKLESIEIVRSKLEKDCAGNIAECSALKRTLELERKERSELEKRAMELIRASKLKWEITEKNRIETNNLKLKEKDDIIHELKLKNNSLNEQLQNILKSNQEQTNYLNKMENFERRSVIGLESRLEKVTNETKNTINDLEYKLNNEIHEKYLLEQDIIKLKLSEEKLKGQLHISEDNFDNFKEKVNELNNVIKKLNERIDQLENDIELNEKYKSKIEEYEKELNQCHEELKNFEIKTLKLENDNKLIDELKSQINILNKELLVKNQKISETENNLEKNTENITVLKKQLNEKIDKDTNNDELKELKLKYWKLEKNYNNSCIDKRILERELKEKNKEMKLLNEKITNLNEELISNKKFYENSLLELNNINELTSMDLLKLRESNKNLQEKFSIEREKNNNEKCIINELKTIINTRDKKIAEINSLNDKIQLEKLTTEKLFDKLENEKKTLLCDFNKLKQTNNELEMKLNNKIKELNNLELNTNALREACMLLENQIVAFEKLNEKLKNDNNKLKLNIENLLNDLNKSNDLINETKLLLNNEKSINLLNQTKIQRLNEDLRFTENELNSYKKQCIEYKELINSLSDDLKLSDEKLNELNLIIETNQADINNILIENNLLKEEISKYLTELNQFKDKNHKSSQEIKQLRLENNGITQRMNELETILTEKTNYYNERELKCDLTIKQQLKLIDFLQLKIDEHNSKKKTLTDRLFGNSGKKDNQQQLQHQQKLKTLNSKDVELELLKEKELNKKLQNEIFQLKAELKNFNSNNNKLDLGKKSPKVINKLVEQSNESELFQRNCIQRMSHNIPHRFEQKLCKKPTKCGQCSKHIMIGRNTIICSECRLLIHPNCRDLIKSTCGLPYEYLRHYRNSLGKLNDNKLNEDNNNSDVMESWLKIPKKGTGWQKYYGILQNKKLLIIFKEKPNNDNNNDNSNIIKQIEINEKGKVILEPLISEIDIPVATNDLPFILKIELLNDSNNTCWPNESFIFMTLSIPERDKWYKAFSEIFHGINAENDNYNIETIITLPSQKNIEQIYINCILDLTENIKILGCEQGLYCYNNKNLLKLDGITDVHHISIVPSTSRVVMICNIKSILISCDLNHLISLTQCIPCTKPKLIYKTIDINNLNGYHILQISKYQKHQMFCVATSKQLIILKYDVIQNDFIPIRILDTAEPTSCIIFTEFSLIVGADKYFEIDLKTYQAEEFLDSTDINLKQALNCYKIQSYPINIVQLNKNPKLYLICFNEFCLIVDEFGHTTNQLQEIKSNFFPLSYHFIQSFLYIVQFNGIEIIEFNSNENLFVNLENMRRIDLHNMRYIGETSKGIYVSHLNTVKLMQGKKLSKSISVSSIATSSTLATNDDDIGRFSFTSSIMQSLDGNLSDEFDVEDNDSRKKGVTFAQTNL